MKEPMEDPVIEEEEEWVQKEAVKPVPALDERMFREPVKNLHRRHEVCLHVQLGTAVAEAIRLMKEHRTGCVLVLDGERLVGIFTERDMLYKMLGTPTDPAKTPVEALMTKNPEVLSMDDEVAYAIHKMGVGGFRHIPIVDRERRPVGVLSVKDVLDHMVGFFPHRILNLPPEPGKDHARTPEGA